MLITLPDRGHGLHTGRPQVVLSLHFPLVTLRCRTSYPLLQGATEPRNQKAPHSRRSEGLPLSAEGCCVPLRRSQRARRRPARSRPAFWRRVAMLRAPVLVRRANALSRSPARCGLRAACERCRAVVTRRPRLELGPPPPLPMLILLHCPGLIGFVAGSGFLAFTVLGRSHAEGNYRTASSAPASALTLAFSSLALAFSLSSRSSRALA